MHVLFIHPNFPAQFRSIAPALARDDGWECAFATGTGRGGQEGGQDHFSGGLTR